MLNINAYDNSEGHEVLGELKPEIVAKTEQDLAEDFFQCVLANLHVNICDCL